MRIVSVLLLMTSACALAACAGGGGGAGTGSSSLSAAGVLASKNGIYCDILTDCDVTPASTTPPSDPDSDGDGIPDSAEGTGDGSTGSGAGGNTTTDTKGNRTIALQLFKLDKPAKGKTAISQLSSAGLATMDDVENAILSPTKPSSMKFTINTNTTNNTQWAVPLEMGEDVYGTRDLRWIKLGHVKPSFAAQTIQDRAGNPIAYDAAANTFRYTATSTYNDETFIKDEEVDFAHDDFYWDQIKAYMGSKANAGAGGKYREYNVKDQETNRDELLQVWAFDNSYAVQYQNQIIKTDAKQQAWTFGGNETKVMPTTGKSIYNGRFAATAKNEGWKPRKDSEINPNTVWKVQGRSEITADFDKSTVTGTLTPETWTSYQTRIDDYYTWFTTEAANPVATNTTMKASKPTSATPDYTFYSTKIKLKGTIAADDTVTNASLPPTPPVKNIYAGDAELLGFKTGDNTMQGGFYGSGATESTGAFAVTGTRTEQIGGSDGQIESYTARESINGVFNGQCTPGATCAP
jgi:C-lobe and N-lobe beta barrels of Tf-binding protein B